MIATVLGTLFDIRPGIVPTYILRFLKKEAWFEDLLPEDASMRAVLQPVTSDLEERMN